MQRRRVVLAMSGGVDSSVSAYLLREQGYDVVGLFMRTGAHEPEETAEGCATGPKKVRGCCSAVDAGDAQRVADRLDLPFYALDFEGDFSRIKDYFVDEYLRGRTPNPCVVCNTWVKFGRLWEYARALEADCIATGHYARIEHGPGGEAELHRGADPAKDQSYFLFGLRADLLPRLIFPIGGMQKAEVRKIAEEQGLGVHHKPDSQEVCFVPDGDYQGFIDRHRPAADPQAGEIVDHEGTVLGRHAGVSRFTIGQRKGLGVAVGEPRYVLELDAERQRVVVGPQELLLRESLEAGGVNWLMAERPTAPIRCAVKIRYLHRPTPAVVMPLADDRVEVSFDEPQSAVTPGQVVAFYEGARLLGGAWID